MVLNCSSSRCNLIKALGPVPIDLDIISGHYLGVVLTAINQFEPPAEFLAKPSSAGANVQLSSSSTELPPPVFEVDVGNLRIFAHSGNIDFWHNTYYQKDSSSTPPNVGTVSSAALRGYLTCLVCSLQDLQGANNANAEKLRGAVEFLGRSFQKAHDLGALITMERQKYEKDVHSSTVQTLTDDTHNLNPDTADDFVAFEESHVIPIMEGRWDEPLQHVTK